MFKLFILKLLPNYYYILYLFINFTYSWDEQDETKRIAQIKEEEKRIFEFQTGQKLSLNNNNNNAQNLFNENYIPSEYFSSQNLLNKKQNSFIKLNESFHKEININWCFYCASPLNILTEQMQRVIKNLLSVRRAQFPSSESIIKDCINPINLNLLPRQICQGYSHCQTLILTDHNAGNSFVLRGCAERFGAVDPEVLMKRKDNSCLKLHDQVDIQECICEKRKYCYSGTERSWTNKYIEIEKWKDSWIVYEEISEYPITKKYIENIINHKIKLYNYHCAYCGKHKGIENNSIQCINSGFWIHGRCADYTKKEIRQIKINKFKCRHCIKEELKNKEKINLN